VRRELRHEDISVPRRHELACPEVEVTREPPGEEERPGFVGADAGSLGGGEEAKALAREVVAVQVVLGKKRVRDTTVRERSTAEVDRPVDLPCDVRVPERVAGDGRDLDASAEALAPEVITDRTELRHEDGRFARRGLQRPATEIDGGFEASREDH